MPRLTRYDAIDRLNACGVMIGDDFHRLRSETVFHLIVCADADNYRKPRNANGSRARYYHARLQRAARRIGDCA